MNEDSETQSGADDLYGFFLHELSIWKKAKDTKQTAAEHRIADRLGSEIRQNHSAVRITIFDTLDKALEKVSLNQTALRERLYRCTLERHPEPKESSG